MLELASAGNVRPTVVQVIADDLGYNDLGYKNGITLTPTIDALVRDGVRLTDYYVMTVCSPTRSSFMTGRYPWHQGIYYVGGQGQAVNETFSMLPALLKPAGYKTVAVGKWHLGYWLKAYTATYRGFDAWLGYYDAAMQSYWYHGGKTSGCRDNFSTDLSNNTGPEIAGADASANGTYSTRLFTQFAVDQITAHFSEAPSTPLYMYLAHEAVHDASGNGIQAPLGTVSLYDSKIIDDTAKVAAAAATELDWSIGNVTDALRAAGVWNNTVLIFSTDNGGPLDHAYNSPLRGGKHTYWEGGVRGESFVYSALLPSKVRGTSWSGLSHACDWYTTIVEGIAGIAMPTNTGVVPVDGHNLWPTLTGVNTTSPRTEVIIQAADPAVYNTTTTIRVGPLKLIIGPPGDSRVIPFPQPPAKAVPFGQSGGKLEPHTDHCSGLGRKGSAPSPPCNLGCLFDVEADPSEKKDLSSKPEYATQLAMMRKRLVTAAEGALPPQELFSGHDAATKAAKAANQAAMDTICANTGFLEPGDSGPPSPSPPPSPPPPPPPPPAACKAALEKVCPLGNFHGDYEKCLACTRDNDPPACSPKARQAYCHGLII